VGLPRAFAPSGLAAARRSACCCRSAAPLPAWPKPAHQAAPAAQPSVTRGARALTSARHPLASPATPAGRPSTGPNSAGPSSGREPCICSAVHRWVAAGRTCLRARLPPQPRSPDAHAQPHARRLHVRAGAARLMAPHSRPGALGGLRGRLCAAPAGAPPRRAPSASRHGLSLRPPTHMPGPSPRPPALPRTPYLIACNALSSTLFPPLPYRLRALAGRGSCFRRCACWTC
jgi:hypothetical protein